MCSLIEARSLAAETATRQTLTSVNGRDSEQKFAGQPCGNGKALSWDPRRVFVETSSTQGKPQDRRTSLPPYCNGCYTASADDTASSSWQCTTGLLSSMTAVLDLKLTKECLD